jgi:transposase
MAARAGKSRSGSAGSKARKPTSSRKSENLKALERRRLQAGRMFEQGATQAEVVRKLGVSRNSASRWYQLWRSGGKDALRSERRAGRPQRLSRDQLKDVEAELLKGAAAHGYPTDLWTLERVAEVIQKRTGVSYNPTHVWRVLKSMGWSLQRPARKAKERDNRAVRRWVKKCWPRIVARARRRGAWLVFEDESGISLTPSVRRTWAPKAKTPVITHPFNWKRASMAAALCYTPDGRRARLVFQIRPGTYNDDAIIDFVIQLRRELRGAKATLIWDGLPSHRSKRTRAFLGTQRRWLVVERLPAYAPELNPVESVWSQLKGKPLAGLVADTLDVVIDATRRGVDRLRRKRSLLLSFLRRTGLSFCPSYH